MNYSGDGTHSALTSVVIVTNIKEWGIVLLRITKPDALCAGVGRCIRMKGSEWTLPRACTQPEESAPTAPNSEKSM